MEREELEPKWKAKRQRKADERDDAIKGHVEEPAEQMISMTGASSSSSNAKPPMPAGPLSAQAEDEQRPVALDLMSGVNFPLGKALTWCGWYAESYDILIDKKHNMLEEATQAHLLEKVATTDLTLVGQDDKTLFRIRERHVPGYPEPPQPLRDEAHVKGLPGLSKENQRSVDDANALVKFTCSLIRKAVENKNGFGVENPKNSLLWQLIPMMDDVLRGDQYMDTLYVTCSSGGARRRMHIIRHNVEEFGCMESECHHEHDRKE